MSRSLFHRLLFIAGIALCAVLGFVAGKALTPSSPVGATAGYAAIRTDAPTPAPASGSLAQNAPVSGPLGTADGPAEAPESDLSGTVAQVDTAHGNLTLATAQGNVVVAVTPQTEFDDGLNGLGDIRQGMALDIAAQQQAGGQLTANSIQTADPSPDSATD